MDTTLSVEILWNPSKPGASKPGELSGFYGAWVEDISIPAGGTGAITGQYLTDKIRPRVGSAVVGLLPLVAGTGGEAYNNPRVLGPSEMLSPDHCVQMAVVNDYGEEEEDDLGNDAPLVEGEDLGKTFDLELLCNSVPDTLAFSKTQRVPFPPNGAPVTGQYLADYIRSQLDQHPRLQLVATPVPLQRHKHGHLNILPFNQILHFKQIGVNPYKRGFRAAHTAAAVAVQLEPVVRKSSKRRSPHPHVSATAGTGNEEKGKQQVEKEEKRRAI